MTVSKFYVKIIGYYPTVHLLWFVGVVHALTGRSVGFFFIAVLSCSLYILHPFHRR
nr:MAG TPA: hypothetical protein [Caudoviricetes sp.]